MSWMGGKEKRQRRELKYLDQSFRRRDKRRTKAATAPATQPKPLAVAVFVCSHEVPK